MGNDVAGLFSQLGHILGICPYCEDLFYLSEAHPYLTGKKPHCIIDVLRAEERRLDRLQERLDGIEDELREIARKAGLRAAKRVLKKVDQLFSGSGYNPHDVKVIFDPVSYIVFNGIESDRLREIVLLANPAKSISGDRLQNSIRKAIDSGNFEFRILHVDGEGKVDS